MKKLMPIIAATTLAAASAAFAQTTTSPTAPTMPSTTLQHSGSTMTATEAAAWVKKPIYSSDNKNIGEVTAVDRDASGNVTGLQADIGGFLGMGSTRVRIAPTDYTLGTDRVMLKKTSAEAKDLPRVPQ